MSIMGQHEVGDEAARGLAACGLAGEQRDGRARLLQNPLALERAGVALALRLAGHGVDLIVSWDCTADVVLAHVVAKALGVTGVVAGEQAGCVELDGPLPLGAQVAVVTDAFRHERELWALSNVVQRAGGAVVAAAVIVGTSILTRSLPPEMSVVSLTDGTAGNPEPTRRTSWGARRRDGTESTPGAGPED